MCDLMHIICLDIKKGVKTGEHMQSYAGHLNKCKLIQTYASENTDVHMHVCTYARCDCEVFALRVCAMQLCTRLHLNLHELHYADSGEEQNCNHCQRCHIL